MSVRSCSRARRPSSSCSSAASLSIENGHSYGYETNGIRSCLSTPATGPPESSGGSSSSTGSVATRRVDQLRQQRRGGERLPVRPARRGSARGRPRRRAGRRGCRGPGRSRLQPLRCSAAASARTCRGRAPGHPCECAGTSGRAASRTWRRRRWRQCRRPAAEAACSRCRHPDRRGSVTPGQHLVRSAGRERRRRPRCADRRRRRWSAGLISAMLWNGRDEDPAVGQIGVQVVLELGGRPRPPTRSRCAAPGRRSGTRRGRRAGRPTTAGRAGRSPAARPP